MKKLAITTLLTCFTFLNAASVKVEEGALEPNHIVYVAISNSFDGRNIKDMDQHLIHFGVGSRALGTHKYDVSSHVAFNHDYLRSLFQVNYLFAPKEFFGGYIGLGVKGGVEVKRNERILNSHSPRALAAKTEFGESYFPESDNGVLLERTWTQNWIADVPLIVGFNFVKENRHQFIQAEVNKDLKFILTSGIGF